MLIFHRDALPDSVPSSDQSGIGILSKPRTEESEKCITVEYALVLVRAIDQSRWSLVRCFLKTLFGWVPLLWLLCIMLPW